MKRNASRIISLILAAAMTVSCFTCTSFADETEVAETAEVIEETAPEEAVAEEEAAAPEEAVEEVVAEEEAATDEAVAEDEAAADEAVADEAAEEAVEIAADEEIGAIAEGDLGTPEAGQTYTINFVDELQAKGFEVGASVTSFISADTMLKYAGNGRFNDTTHGLAVSAGDVMEIAVAGNADITLGACQYSDKTGLFTVTNAAGESLGTISAYNASCGDETLSYKGEAGVLTLTYSGGQGYISKVTIANAQGPIGEAESFEFWLDDIADGGVVEPGVYNFADSKIELIGNGSTKFTPEISAATNLTRGNRTGVNAYKAGARNKDANNIPTIPQQGDGTAVIFTPAADGMFNAYFYTTAAIRVHDFNLDGSKNGTQDSATAAENLAVNAKAGHVYVFSTTGSTNNAAFAGFEYIIDEPVSTGLTWTEDDKYTYDSVEVTFIDTAFGAQTNDPVAVKGASGVTLMKGHTYELKTNDGGARATVNGELTFVADGNPVKIDLTAIADETLTGSILGDKDVVSGIKFVNMVNGNVTEAVYDAAAGTYTASIKPGDYNTVVTANGFYTNDRVKVTEDGVEDKNDIFLEPLGNATYALKDEINNSATALTFTGFKYHSEQYGVSGGVGATIVVPAVPNQTITVSGSYDGRFSIVGNGASSEKVDSGNAMTATYATAADDTEVTITVEETGNIAAGSGSAYLSTIKAELAQEAVPFKAEISVPGDYDTLTEAVSAIKLMADRPEGEAGRITISLTADLQEQVVFDAPYITLDGNDHEINWYYGQTGFYYSVGADGLYNESLFYDKYSKTEGNGSLWGGVVIVRGDYFRAKNTTFRNTFNYEVTDKEIEDGAEGRGKVSGIITKDSPVQSYDAKERSNAFYVEAKGIELYKCKVLSSQDSFGRNGSADGGYSIYVKDSVIGGNVDYICGEFKAVFENCELQWKTYGAGDAKNNGIGYIVAPKTNPYVFINCEVTVDDPTATNTLGKFGRTWGAGSATYFVNCETNGYIDNTGWGEMSNGDGTTSKFFEYGNTKNGESFTTSGLANSPQSNVLSEDTDAETISSLTGDEIYNDYLGSNFFGSEIDKGIRGDVDENSIVTANDAAVLLAYITPGSNIKKGNFTNYVADVAGIYNNPDDQVSTIDSADVALIFAKVLNSATEFNTPIEKPFYKSEEVTP